MVSIDDYREALSYDANGNILTYKRNGSAGKLDMDKMTYQYPKSADGKILNNRLRYVHDEVDAAAYAEDIDSQTPLGLDLVNKEFKPEQQTDNYVYDAIGNLVQDKKEGINTINWNVYGKIEKIEKQNSTISYRYDAGGNRISKTVGNTSTFYLRDASGNVMSTYTVDANINNGNLTQNEVHLYGSSRLGIHEVNRDVHIPAKADYLNKTNTFVTGNVRYELTDHLGNVMAVVSDKKIAYSLEQVCDGNDNCWNIVSGYTPDVISATDYAPFGMSLSGRKFNGGEYRFGFNGQMKDHDIDANGNHYTAEFWEYSADLGRRWNLDPKPNVSFSSYATFNDNPIWFSDPKGDTAGIRINRRQEVKYVGGQWIDSRTRNVVNTNDVRNSGVRRLMNDYNTLNSISEFNPVTSKINSAKNDIKLSPTAGSSTGGSETNTPKYFADLARGIAHPAINVNSIANDNIDYSLFEGGKRHDIPSYVKLGHELGHVHDILSTTPSTANFTQISGATPGISNSESNAMYWENILRVHTNLPLRLFYNNNGAALEYPANVTIGTMTIKGGKLDIKTNKITPLEIGTPILLQGLRGTPSSNFFRKAKL